MRAPLYSANPNELFERATIANPHPLYARLRAQSPVSRVAQTGVHLVATWDRIEEALGREADFSANLTGVLMRGAAGDPEVFAMPDISASTRVIATADEPDHTIHRALAQPRLAGKLVADLEPTIRCWAQAAVRDWLGGAHDGDFVPVAELVPARVVGALLGLPDGDVSRFRIWAMLGGDILAGDADLKRLETLTRESGRMGEYLGAHLDAAGATLRADDDAPLLHALARGVADRLIARDDAIGIATTMFGAGGESTAALLGTLVWYLAERPEMADLLRLRPERIGRFVEEVARLDPPFNFHYRAVRRPCTLGGYSLDRGDRLMLLWASANRDAKFVEDPDVLRLDRKHPKNHLTFGRGSHFCIGAPVARMEAKIVCEELLAATRSFRLRPDRPPEWANSIFIRRLEHLPLEAIAAG